MEIKDFIQKLKKTESLEYLFALQIEEKFVKSAIWLVDEDVVKVLSFGPTQDWESEEELVEAVDATLSAATENLTLATGIKEPSKVILGIPTSWVHETTITPQKLELIRDLSKKLELSPVGFVVTNEAIVHHLKTIEGVPPTAILVRLKEKELTITLVKLGEIIGSELVLRSENLGADVCEGLSRFNREEIFPPRILFINRSSNIEEERQELIDYPWSEGKLNFLHLPKVEILPPNFDIKAVALAGGREVAKAVAVQTVPLEKEPTGEKEEVVVVPAGSEEPLPSPAPELKEDFLSADDMGFVQGEIGEKELPAEIEPPARLEEKKKFSLPFGRISGVLDRWRLPQIGSPPKLTVVFLGILIFLIAIVALAAADSFYFPKAEATIVVRPKVIQEKYRVSFDPATAETDKEKLLFPGVQTKTVLEGEEKGPATGVKSVGEAAKGEVTVFNQTNVGKTFNAGAEIAGPMNLKFAFDEEVTVASASAGPGYIRIPGKAKVKVTARTIGPEGNLAANSEFSIANYSRSDFIASNESAFSGGTSREIQVVSDQDKEKLLAKLTKKLESEALPNLGKKAGHGQKIIDESLKSRVMDESSIPKTGEEADEVTVKEKIEFLALSYNEEELKAVLEELAKNLVPAGFLLRREDIRLDFNLDKVTKEGVAIFNVSFQANLLTELETAKIKKDIAGKSLLFAESYLGNLPNVVNVQLVVSGSLLKRFSVVPLRTENITIKLISSQ